MGGARIARVGLPGLLALAGVASIGTTRAIARDPLLAEELCTGGWPGRASLALARASSRVPLNLAEAALAAGTLAGIVAAFHLARGLRRPPRLPRLRRAAAWAGAVSALVGASFDLAWGLNYARPPLATRLGWPARPWDEPATLARLAAELVEATNRAYASQRGPAATGVTGPIDALDAALDRGMAIVAERLRLPPIAALPRGPAKPVLASAVMSRFGISGFYFPWTGEASYNRDVPACALPHTLAHEKAHQRGFAREDEAEMIGFLAAAWSGDPHARAAALLFAQRELLVRLALHDREATVRLVARRDAAVQRDVDELRAFWQQHEGRASDLGRAVNDRYLRAQGVAEGIASYDHAARLLVLWAEARGSAVP